MLTSTPLKSINLLKSVRTLWLSVMFFVGVTIHIQAAQPIITSTPPTATQDIAYEHTSTASDADGDYLNWNIKEGTDLASWLHLDILVSTLTGQDDDSNGSVDGTGSAASFKTPTSVAVDSNDNIYVADQFNNKIRKITPAGVVTTFAGSGVSGFADGNATTAQFARPTGVAVDSNDNVYVADYLNHRIRKITPAGVVSTFAGTGTDGYTNGNAAVAQFKFPTALAIGSNDKIYVADQGNNKIRKITQAGNVSTYSSIASPTGIAVDSSGKVYVSVASEHTISIISSGLAITFTGQANTSGSTDASGPSALFNGPTGLAVDSFDNIYVADNQNNKIRKITPAGVVSTFSGSSVKGSADANTASASFSNPTGIVVDSRGRFYVADQGNNKIRKIIYSSTLSGTPTNADVGVSDVNLTLSDGTTVIEHNFQIEVVNINDLPSSQDFSFTIQEDENNTFVSNDFDFIDVDANSTFYSLYITSLPSSGTLTLSGVALSSDEEILTANIANLVFTPDANESGTPYTSFNFVVNDGDANSTGSYTATINVTAVNDLAVVTSTPLTRVLPNTFYEYELFASDAENDTLTWGSTDLPDWLSLQTAEVSTFAGTGVVGSVDSSEGNATFNGPFGGAIDSNGNIYIVDTLNNKIRKITPDGVVSTFAGQADNTSGSMDGNSTIASFYAPRGIAVDSSGNIYIADSDNNKIRKITSAGVVSTFAGKADNSSGSADDNATIASFNTPIGIAIDSSDNLYVTDGGNHKIRKITPSGVVSTIAGQVDSGSADGNATAASFNAPAGIALDSNNNVYVADWLNHKIRKITPAGVVSTFAGAAGSASAGFEDGDASIASFNGPWGLAVDSSDNIYVADEANSRIRKITQAGVVSTFAGSGEFGLVNGNVSTAEFKSPTGVLVDSNDDIYIVDTNIIRKITKTNPILSGTPTNAEIGSHDVNLTLSDGTTTVEHNFVIKVNGAPSSADVIFILDEDIAKTFSMSDFNFTDANIGDTLVSLFITGLTNAGRLTYEDVIVSLYQEITDLTSLVFTPDANASGTPYTSFDFVVNDGDDNSTDSYTATINVDAVNDPAVVTSIALTTATQDTPYEYVLEGNDVDGDALAWFSTSIPSWLSLEYGIVTTLAGTGSFNSPYGLVVDNNGNIYVADKNNNKIKKITKEGVVTTFAGSGVGFEDGNVTEAKFNRPRGITIDSEYNIYVADTLNHRIRKITPAGVVTTFAGSGDENSTDGNGTLASFYKPSGLAVDSNDNIYVADSANNKIRKITPAGVVSTLAGNINNSSGDSDGTGAAASFSNPSGVAVDSKNNIYVADTSNFRIRKITPAGVVTTFAGSEAGFLNDTGTSSMFRDLSGIAIDSQDNVYVSDRSNQKIRKITPAGVVTTFAGSDIGFVDGLGSIAKFNYPFSIAVDSEDKIYVVDSTNDAIRKIIPINSLVGTPTNSDVGVHDINLTLSDGTSSVEHNFVITVENINDIPTSQDFSFTIDEDTNNTFISNDFNFTDVDVNSSFNSLYITVLPSEGVLTLGGDVLSVNEEILEANIANLVYSTEANVNGTPYSSFSFIVNDGESNSTVYTATINVNAVDDPILITSTAVTSASQDTPYSYVIDINDVDGDVLTWSTDSLPSWLSLATPQVSTFVGNGANGNVDGNATDASFKDPVDIAIDSNGNFYVVDSINFRIRKITPEGVVSTFAGSSYGFADGNATEAKFSYPSGIAIDSNDNLYIADTINHKIRKITPAGIVSTLAGNSRGYKDANGTAAKFWNPQGVAVDSDDNIYVADKYNNRIRKITQEGVVTTFAGSGSGFVDANGTAAKFKAPVGIAIDTDGNLYVSDSENHAVRKITPAGVVTTLAGNGSSGSLDGTGVGASFNLPAGIAIDSSGIIYVADSQNNTIRKITAQGVVTTLAGNGSGDSVDGSLSESSFKEPYGIVVDSDDNLYIADKGSKVIRKIIPKTTLSGTPSNADVGVHDVNLTLSDGTTSVEHNFEIKVNGAPSSADAIFTLDEDIAKTFSISDFNFTDPNDGDALVSLFITTLPNAGALTLNDVDVSLNQEITSADIVNLKFTPALNAYGTPYTTFGFKVNDGEFNSTLAYTVTINVNVLDTDNDTIPDSIDDDKDGDGVLNINDDFPLDANEWIDSDGDGTGNNADRDDDNDGIYDTDEVLWGFDPLDASDGHDADADNDGVSNKDEIQAGSDPLDPTDTKIPKTYAPIMVNDILIMVPYE